MERCEKVKIIADTLNPWADIRVTTFLVEIPIYTRTHILTHRAFSRNGASSRAMPLEKCDYSYTPYVFPKENKRMIPGDYWPRDSPEHEALIKHWNNARHVTLGLAGLEYDDETGKCKLKVDNLLTSNSAKAHKEIASRLLEPFKLVQFIITATEFDNFFNLRCDSAAQDSVQYVAKQMREQRIFHDSRVCKYHLPFITAEEFEEMSLEQAYLISAGRCASVSFGTTKKDNEKALRLADRLQKDGHWSPFEHQAILDPACIASPKVQGNFCRGAMQFRRILQSPAPLRDRFFEKYFGEN